MEHITISGGVPFTVLRSDKFKTNSFSLNFFLPLSDEYISSLNVLSRVMSRGTKNYPNILSLGRKLDSLYSTSIAVFCTKMISSAVFRIVVNFLDDRFIPEGDETDIFGEALDIVKEMLTDPLTEGDGLKKDYVESEKSNQISVIKAQINNKDSYAVSRGMKTALGNIPFACDGCGTVGEVGKLTPEKLHSLLRFLLAKAPVEATFAGHFTESYKEKTEKFIADALGNRNSCEILPIGEKILPAFEDGVKNTTEDIDAKQGRLFITFKVSSVSGAGAVGRVLSAAFGGSVLSGLFTNVREKLHLCYYCSSGFTPALSLINVRSGIAPENKDKALDAILSELDKLKDPENITDIYLDTIKKEILSAFVALRDDVESYVNWYILRKYNFDETDLEKAEKDIRAVTKEQIAEMARATELKAVYFLNGTAKDEKETEDGEDED